MDREAEYRAMRDRQEIRKLLTRRKKILAFPYAANSLYGAYRELDEIERRLRALGYRETIRHRAYIAPTTLTRRQVARFLALSRSERGEFQRRWCRAHVVTRRIFYSHLQRFPEWLARDRGYLACGRLSGAGSLGPAYGAHMHNVPWT